MKLTPTTWKLLGAAAAVAVVASFIMWRHTNGPRGSYIPDDVRRLLMTTEDAFGKDEAAGCAALAEALPTLRAQLGAPSAETSDAWRRLAPAHVAPLEAASALCDEAAPAKAAYDEATGKLRLAALRPRTPLALLALGGLGFMALGAVMIYRMWPKPA